MGDGTGQFKYPYQGGFSGQAVNLPSAGTPSITGGSLNYGGQLGSVPLDQGFDTNANVSSLMGGNSNAAGPMAGLGGGGFNIPNAQPGLMEKVTGGDYGSLQGWGQMLGGIGDIGSAYMAYKNYGLAKDQFAFQKDVTNRNLANQSSITNARMEAWSRVRGMKAPKTDGTAIG